MKKRLKFIYWLRRMAKIPEGEKASRWIVVIYVILFPIRAICHYQKQINFDMIHNILIINGVEYSMGMLDDLSTLANKHDMFEIISRETSYGKKIVTLKHIKNKTISNESTD